MGGRPSTEEIVNKNTNTIKASGKLIKELNGMFDKVEDVNNKVLVKFKDQIPAYYLRNGTFQSYDKDVVSGIMGFVNKILQPVLNPVTTAPPGNAAYFANNKIDLKAIVSGNALEIAKAVQMVMQGFAENLGSSSTMTSKQQNQVLTISNNVFACYSVFMFSVESDHWFASSKCVFTGFSIKIIYSNALLQNILQSFKYEEAISSFQATAAERARQRQEKVKLIKSWEATLAKETNIDQATKISDFIKTQTKLLDDLDYSKLLENSTSDLTTQSDDQGSQKKNRDDANKAVASDAKPFPAPTSSDLPDDF